ncbi:MAG: hypothetical protein J7K17_02275 [Candidatus Omnitrophica bacterium]|nr:hypothetical protein [Candidatus Omnitrophota bacterium]
MKRTIGKIILFAGSIWIVIMLLPFYSLAVDLPVDKKVHYDRITSFYSDRFFSWPAISNPQAAGLSATVIPESTPNSERGFEEAQPTPQGGATSEGEGNVISPGNSGDILPPTNTGVVAPPGNGGVIPPQGGEVIAPSSGTGNFSPSGVISTGRPTAQSVSPDQIPVVDGNYSFSPWQREIIDNVLNVLGGGLISGIREIAAVSGEYLGLTRILPGGGQTFISNINSPSMFLYTLVHEIGHTVDFYVLPDELRQQFYSLFDRNPDNHVTAYSMTNPQEDFAETFATYLTNREALLARAQAQAEEGNDILLRKVRIIEEILELFG